MNWKNTRTIFFSYLFILFFLTGCNRQEVANLKYEKFSDIVLNHNYQKKYGTITGLKGVYAMYGKLPTGLIAGTAITFGHKFIFQVKEVTDEHPELLTPAVQQTIDQQEKIFNAYGK